MKKLLILLIFIGVFSYADMELPFCWLDHKPESTWPDTWPKGVAGETLVYGIVTFPMTYGWTNYINDPNFAALVTIVTAYETYYQSEMDDVKAIMESASTDDYTEAEAVSAIDEVYGIMYEVDMRYIEDGYDCRALIPDNVWNNYISE